MPFSLSVSAASTSTTLFPYTTLFRSSSNRGCNRERLRNHYRPNYQAIGVWGSALAQAVVCKATRQSNLSEALSRSEEHTSELQSRGHLVCRLLLEKKQRTRRTADTNV